MNQDTDSDSDLSDEMEDLPTISRENSGPSRGGRRARGKKQVGKSRGRGRGRGKHIRGKRQKKVQRKSIDSSQNSLDKDSNSHESIKAKMTSSSEENLQFDYENQDEILNNDFEISQNQENVENKQNFEIDSNKQIFQNNNNSDNFHNNFQDNSQDSSQNNSQDNSQDDSLSPPVLSKQKQETKIEVSPIQFNFDINMTKITIVRDIKKSIKGSRYYYLCQQQDSVLYRAKALGRYPKHMISISTTNNLPHISSPEYKVSISHKKIPCYTLFKQEEKILSVTQSIENKSLFLPPTWEVSLFGGEIPEMELITKKPHVDSSGHFVLDFYNQYTIPSSKNCVFIRKNREFEGEYIFIRKIADQILEIEYLEIFPPLVPFTVGLCIFCDKIV